MIKKLQLLIVFFFLSGLQLTFAQAETERAGHTENSELRIINVKWKSATFDNKVLDKIAQKITEMYSERIASIAHPDLLQSLIVKYTLQIKEEDILQIIRAQGIYDAYFISEQTRYFLDDEGIIRNEPTKEF